MKKISYSINNETMTGFCEKVGRETWVCINNKTFKFETQGSRKKRAGAQSSANPKEIHAPMPGKITAIKRKTGDAIKAGEIVIVMEAMKMEYSLKANMDGTIDSIKVKEGDQVILGQLLIGIN